MLTFFVIVSWWVVGVAGFVFWWTKEFDFTFGCDILMSCIVGIAGPVSWVIGYLVHGQPHEFIPKVMIKKRGAGENGVGE